MDEDVLLSILGLREAKPLAGVVPLYGARDFCCRLRRRWSRQLRCLARPPRRAPGMQNISDRRHVPTLPTLGDSNTQLGARGDGGMTGALQHFIVQKGLTRAVAKHNEAKSPVTLEPFDRCVQQRPVVFCMNNRRPQAILSHPVSTKVITVAGPAFGTTIPLIAHALLTLPDLPAACRRAAGGVRGRHRARSSSPGDTWPHRQGGAHPCRGCAEDRPPRRGCRDPATLSAGKKGPFRQGQQLVMVAGARSHPYRPQTVEIATGYHG